MTILNNSVLTEKRSDIARLTAATASNPNPIGNVSWSLWFSEKFRWRGKIIFDRV